MRPILARRRGGLAAALILVASCATTTPEAEPILEEPAPISQGSIRLDRVGFDALPGWSTADLGPALDAFLRSCSRFQIDGVSTPEWSASPAAWRAACDEARGVIRSGETVRAFFERRFEPALLSTADGDVGLATAYYEPELEVSRSRSGLFDEPLLRPPPGLRTVEVADPDRGLIERKVVINGPGGAPTPAPSRADLVADASAENAIAWGRVEDVVFLQIQGSGRVRFPDGSAARAAYAGHNGQPYVSIAKILIDAGELPADQASNARIRAWLASQARDRVAAMLNRNSRYVFFELKPIGDPSEGPVGAARTPLTADVSVAVDPAHHPYGAVYWMVPEGAGAPAPRLAVAQDTGGAIRGPLRVDLFFGSGAAAGAEADVVKHPVTWWALLPKSVEDDRLASR